MTGAVQACVICEGPIAVPLAAWGRRICGSPQCQWLYEGVVRLRQSGCAICGASLTLPEKLSGVLCERQECRAAYRLKVLQRVSFCRVCNRELANYLTGKDSLCEGPACRRQFEEELRGKHQHNLREKALAEAKQHAGAETTRIQRVSARVDETFRRQGVDSPSVFVVPANGRPLAPPAQQSMQAMRRHLERLARQAASREPDGDKDPRHERPVPSSFSAEELSLLGAGCATCRGRCCLWGAENMAYIDAATMDAYLCEHPEKTVEQVVEDYLSHMPDLTAEHSCVFHGEKGCTLPKGMRSSTCTQWHCDSLAKFRHAFAKSDPRFVIFASAVGEEVLRITAIDRDREAGMVRTQERTHL